MAFIIRPGRLAVFAMCISVSSFVTTYQVATYHRGNRISNGHRQEHCCAGCRCMGASINKMGASTEVWCAHNISQHTKRSRYGDDVCPKGCSPICQLQYAPVGVGTIVRRRITGAIAITPRSPHTSVSPRCPLQKRASSRPRRAGRVKSLSRVRISPSWWKTTYILEIPSPLRTERICLLFLYT